MLIFIASWEEKPLVKNSSSSSSSVNASASSGPPSAKGNSWCRQEQSVRRVHGRPTYPQNPEALGQAPPAEEVDLELVVQDHDGVFFPELGVGLGVRVDDALGARPPLQQHHQLCNRHNHTHIYSTWPRGPGLPAGQLGTRLGHE